MVFLDSPCVIVFWGVVSVGLRANIEKQGLKINDEFLQVAEAAQAVRHRPTNPLSGRRSFSRFHATTSQTITLPFSDP